METDPRSTKAIHFMLDATVLEQLKMLAARYESVLGRDRDAYLGHVRRLLRFYEMLREEPADEMDAVAGFFHDLGIWTDRTNDYLPPSEREARAYLIEIGRPEWIEPMAAMIGFHHKLSAYKGPHAERVEPFRKADAIDFSWGLSKQGLAAERIKEVFADDPPVAFRRFLLRVGTKWLLRHPLRPFPIFKC